LKSFRQLFVESKREFSSEILNSLGASSQNWRSTGKSSDESKGGSRVKNGKKHRHHASVAFIDVSQSQFNFVAM
jgi:predicted lactoylglutathione lyase